MPYELLEVEHQDFIVHYLQQNESTKTEPSKEWQKIDEKIQHVLRSAFIAATLAEDGLQDCKNSRAMYHQFINTPDCL